VAAVRDEVPEKKVGDRVYLLTEDGVARFVVTSVQPHEDTDVSGIRVSFTPAPRPVLDHEHEWVYATELQDGERIDICAAGGCSAIRTAPT
jgi:hypothetical protein